MKLRLSLLAIALVLALPAISFADQVITFEGYPSWTVFTNQFPGVNFNGATVLSLSEGSLNPAFPPHSGDNVVYNPTGPMSINFSSPVGYFSGYFTYNDGLEIEAYDSANNLLASFSSLCSANYVGSSCSPNEYGIVTASGISDVVITGGGGNNFTLDDAEFTGSVVTTTPEPSSFLLIGTGLLSALAVLRRKILA